MALDLSEFQKTHVYQVRAPVPEVLEDLKAVGQLDQQAEAVRRKLWIAAWVLLGSGILLAFLVPLFGLVIGLCALVAAVVLFVEIGRAHV